MGKLATKKELALVALLLALVAVGSFATSSQQRITGAAINHGGLCTSNSDCGTNLCCVEGSSWASNECHYISNIHGGKCMISATTTTTILTTNTFKISQGCAIISKSNSIYLVTSDISCTSGNTILFSEGVSNSVLDCQNHRLTHPSYSTEDSIIKLSGNNNNNAIKNCIIDGSGPNSAVPLDGIVIRSSKGNTIENNEITSVYYRGVWLNNSDDNKILNNKFNKNIGSGLLLENSNNNLISNNNADYNVIGISLGDSSNNIIEKNFGRLNGFTVIFVAGSSKNNIIRNNIANENDDDGIVLSYDARSGAAPTNNIIENNVANANFDAGIELVNADFNTIQNNVASNNGIWGIWLKDVGISDLKNEGNIIKFNTLYSNAVIGIKIDSASVNAGNILEGNKEGFTILSSTPITIALWFSPITVISNGQKREFNLITTGITNGQQTATISVDQKVLSPIALDQSIVFDGIEIKPIHIIVPGKHATIINAAMLSLNTISSTTTTIKTTTTTIPPKNSCVGKCGGNAGSCWCDSLCESYGDCCPDYEYTCKGTTTTTLKPCKLTEADCPLICAECGFGYKGGGCAGGINKTTCKCIEPPPCVPITTTTTILTWYRNAKWQCYDGYTVSEGSLTSCKSVDVWKSYAEQSCANRCNNTPGKCGVNSFSVYNPCQDTSSTTVTTILSKGSCVGKCDGNAGSCWCDVACVKYGDCCADYIKECAGTTTTVTTIKTITTTTVTTKPPVTTTANSKITCPSFCSNYGIWQCGIPASGCNAMHYATSTCGSQGCCCLTSGDGK